MTPPHYTNSQIISFGYVDFLAKIFPILYPPVENSTTHTTIIQACHNLQSHFLQQYKLQKLPHIVDHPPTHFKWTTADILHTTYSLSTWTLQAPHFNVCSMYIVLKFVFTLKFYRLSDEYMGSPLSTIFGTWKKSYFEPMYLKFVVVESIFT